METEVSAQIGALPYERSPDRSPIETAPDEDVGHSGRHHRAQDPQGHRGQLFSIAAGAPPAGREGPACGGSRGLRQGNLDPQVNDLVKALGIDGISKSEYLASARPWMPRSRRVSIPGHRRRVPLRHPRCQLPQGQRARPRRGGGVRGRARRDRHRRAPGIGSQLRAF
jgi:hypothetical protein